MVVGVGGWEEGYTSLLLRQFIAGVPPDLRRNAFFIKSLF